MHAKIYFEAQGRRDRSKGLPSRYSSRYLFPPVLPEWAYNAYEHGYVYQCKDTRNMKDYSFANTVILVNGVPITGWYEGDDVINIERVKEP